MEIVITENARAHLTYWKKSGNIKILKKIDRIVKSMQHDPFNGIGKPEALKHELSGYWSRRITKEHRIVYSVADERITIISFRFHY